MFLGRVNAPAITELLRCQRLEAVNSLNTETTIAQYYLDIAHDVHVEAWYHWHYKKEAFASFLAVWTHERRKAMLLMTEEPNDEGDE